MYSTFPLFIRSVNKFAAKFLRYWYVVPSLGLLAAISTSPTPLHNDDCTYRLHHTLPDIGGTSSEPRRPLPDIDDTFYESDSEVAHTL